MFRLIFILILTVAAIFYIKWEYICSQLVVPDIVEWFVPSLKTPAVYGDKIVRQYFIPHYNGFFRVGFRAEYKKPSEAKIEVSVREVDGDTEVFKEVAPLSRSSENRIWRFSFSPQWDSAGKMYCINISSPDAVAETDLKLLYGTWPLFHKMKGGKTYFGDKRLSGELSIVTESRVKVTAGEFFLSWRNFIGDRGFAIFYISIILMALVGLIFLKV